MWSQRSSAAATSASSPVASTDPVFVEPTTPAIANGVSPAARSRATASATGAPRSRNRSSDGMTDERLGWEAEQVERPADREMRLVRGVDADAVEQTAARRPARPEQPSEVDVTGERHPDEVGHHAARRQQPERPGAVADHVAQPADDLLLDERRERAGVPDIDALIGHLREQLAHHRGGQRWRREVPELAWMLGRHLAAGQPPPELVEDVGDRGWPGRGRHRTAAGAEEPRAQLRVWRRVAHRAAGGLVVQEVQRCCPRVGAEPFHRGTRGGLAVADQLGFGVPGEAVVGVVGHGPRW